MHESFAIFNISMWFWCDRKFGKFRRVGELNTQLCTSSIIRVMSLAVASLSRQSSLEQKKPWGQEQKSLEQPCSSYTCPLLSQAGNSRLTERLVQPTVQIWIRRLYASTLQQETKWFLLPFFYTDNIMVSSSFLNANMVGLFSWNNDRVVSSPYSFRKQKDWGSIQ